MSAWVTDLRYGIRSLAKQPGFVAVAVLSLGVGIGVNTAIFSALNALFRPLAVRDPGRTVIVYHARPDDSDRGTSFPAFQRYRDRTDVFSATMAFSAPRPMILVEGDRRDQVYAEIATAAFFTIAAIDLSLGRPFDADVDRVSPPQFVAVLSDRLWKRRFAANPQIVGTTIDLNGHPFAITAVAKPEFHGLDSEVAADIWIPLTTWAQVVGEPARLTGAEHWLTTVAQLKSGVSFEQARAAMAVPAEAAQQAPVERTHVRPSTQRTAGFNLDALAIGGSLFAVGLLVLALAGMNVANLLIARAASRQQEMSVRMALGSGRGRLIRLWLTESLLLSLSAGVIALLFARWMLGVIVALEQPTLVGHSEAPALPLEFTLDLRIFAFALGLSALTAIVIGLVAGLQGSRPGPLANLKTGGPADRSFAPGLNLRSAILALQMAISLFLLIPCALFVRSALNATTIDPGFPTDRVLLLPISTNQSGVKVKKPAGFEQQLADRVALLPGVEGVTVMDPVPLWFGGNFAGFSPESGGVPRAQFGFSRIAPGYFQMLQLPLIRGRDFTKADTASAPPVAIVNETLARRFWPGREAVGQRIKDYDSLLEVVGVARDAKYLSLAGTAEPWLYRPLAQEPTDNPALSLAVRTTGAPFTITTAIEREVKALVPNWPLFQFRTLDEGLELQRRLPRLGAALLGSLGAFGLLLAGMGMYAVTAYVVKQRMREIGIRLAVGAPSASVLALVVRQGLMVCVIGASVGLAAALAATRFLASVLYGVGAADPLSYAVVTMGLLLVAFLACYGPARRATRMNPLAVLRDE